MRKIQLLFIFLLCTCIAFAQSSTIAFQHYGLADGMSDNTVTCLHFDKRGFMWIGTPEGLNRFDGESFLTLSKDVSNPATISGNSITTIEEDATGNLWVGTKDGGICRINKQLKVDLKPSLITAAGQLIHYVHSMHFDRDSMLYVASDKGLFYSRAPYTQFTESTPSVPRACYSLIRGEEGILTSFISQTLFRFKQGNGDVLLSRPYPQDGYTLQYFFRSQSGQIFAGGWDPCLHQYVEKTNTLESKRLTDSGLISEDDELVCMTEAGKDLLWLGMKSGTILWYNIQNGDLGKLPISSEETKRLNGKRIYCMYTDAFNRTWIGTDVGLHVYNPLNSVFNVNWFSEEAEHVYTFASANNKVLIGTNRGLYKTDQHTFEKFEMHNRASYSAESILSLDDKIYVGTSDNLMHEVNGALQPTFDHLPAFLQELKSTSFNAICEWKLHNKNYLLVNPYGHGTILASPDDNAWAGGLVIHNGAIDNLIKNIHRDAQGRIWFLGTSSGISLLEKCTLNGESFPSMIWKLPKEIKGVLNFNVKTFEQSGITKDMSAMIENEDGTFWVGSLGSGLLLFDPGKDSACFTQIKNSPSAVYQIVRDQSGVLWMTARGGILSYNPLNEEWRKFDEKDGIPSAGLSKSLYMHKDGIMYAGGNGFYLTLNTKEKLNNPELPHTTLTGIEVMGINQDSLLYNTQFTLASDQNFITFHFSSLCFNNPTSSTFEYMLEGLDPVWRSCGTANFVDYNNLGFGEYTFKVRAISTSGAVDPREASISFSIRAPFYFRWWFIGIVLITIAGMLFVLVQYRNKQRKKLATMRDKIARDLHDDVGSALGSISFYSETARKTLLENKTDKTADIIHRMGLTSRQMIENMHDIVWAVQSGNDSSMHLVDRMQSVVAEMTSSNNIRIRFECQEEIKSLKMDMNTRKNCYLIFKEALYNSMKYAQCSEIRVRFFKDASGVKLHIADNGVGFDTSRAQGGNGLRNMAIRAEELHGKLSVQSTSAGTRIELHIPSPDKGIF